MVRFFTWHCLFLALVAVVAWEGWVRQLACGAAAIVLSGGAETDRVAPERGVGAFVLTCGNVSDGRY